ncbi:threonylcarbamoyl-AMP synthase [Boudabousia tangfeifanii]|uniref:Threonylcarbamoyl-AMP synthase n=1 Tax=Boudabousia tangfeifanii TaxID=1912795 RepID=A0A1D9MJX3_9ACTO|nr:L-threonylcarbamoyladenylate synthase [Boudabousia tangfeifanii]AOZ72605.1 threonylcarbamoyl-AMP synthase [Boudabousia tangfeifanii]
MSVYLDIHPQNPQPRLIARAVEIIKDGGVVAYPSDSGYALATKLGSKAGLERIRDLRKVDDKHNFTLVCSDFKQLGQYVFVSNSVFRLLKSLTPGPFTFILEGTKEVPRLMLNPKKKTVGVRITDHPVVSALLAELEDTPLVSSTLILPGQSEPLTNGWEIQDELGHLLDAVIEGEIGSVQPSTVVDLTTDEPEIIRQGAGEFPSA